MNDGGSHGAQLIFQRQASKVILRSVIYECVCDLSNGVIIPPSSRHDILICDKTVRAALLKFQLRANLFYLNSLY